MMCRPVSVIKSLHPNSYSLQSNPEDAVRTPEGKYAHRKADFFLAGAFKPNLARGDAWGASYRNNCSRYGLVFLDSARVYGKLAKEAEELARKARAIKIPKRYGRKLEVEYRFEAGNSFCGFRFVKADTQRSQWTMRFPYLDFKLPLRGQKYNKQAGRVLIRDFVLPWRAQAVDRQAMREVFQQWPEFPFLLRGLSSCPQEQRAMFLVRWEYYPQNFLGFVQLACLVILFRRF
jgi:hypothetical protein